MPATEVAELRIVALREKLTVHDIKEMQLDVIVGAIADLLPPTVSRVDLLVRRVLAL